MLYSDIYWLIFSVINCPKTFIKLSLVNTTLQRISQDEQLHKKFIIRGTEQRSDVDFDEYYINLLTDGKLHGNCIKWFILDNNIINYSCEYRNGKLDGISRHYYDSGKIFIITTYRDGKKHGLREIWYDCGQISYKVNYQNDKRNGQYESWFLEGGLHLKTTYIDDKIDGLYESWHHNGKPNETILYKNGQIIQEK